jgi:hypothetical protein
MAQRAGQERLVNIVNEIAREASYAGASEPRIRQRRAKQRSGTYDQIERGNLVEHGFKLRVSLLGEFHPREFFVHNTPYKYDPSEHQPGVVLQRAAGEIGSKTMRNQVWSFVALLADIFDVFPKTLAS